MARCYAAATRAKAPLSSKTYIITLLHAMLLRVMPCQRAYYLFFSSPCHAMPFSARCLFRLFIYARYAIDAAIMRRAPKIHTMPEYTYCHYLLFIIHLPSIYASSCQPSPGTLTENRTHRTGRQRPDHPPLQRQADRRCHAFCYHEQRDHNTIIPRERQRRTRERMN